MLKIKHLLYFAVMIAVVACSSPRKSVSLEWRVGDYNEEKGMWEYHVAIEGLDKAGDDWEIYYSQLPYEIVNDPESPLHFEEVMANYHRITPNENYEPGKRVEARYYSALISRYNLAPENFFIVAGGKNPEPVALKTIFPPLPDNGEELYAENGSAKVFRPGSFDIIPAVKSLELFEGVQSYAEGVSVYAENRFASAAEYLKGRLQTEGIPVLEDGGVRINVLTSSGNLQSGGYRIVQKSGEVTISSSDDSGAFYGAVTLANVLEEGTDVTDFVIEDYPDLQWRGVMMDVARNFTTKENMLRLIDMFARYKVNVLHLHFCDDEGWRIEIDGIDELTSYGAFHDFEESRGLMPSYDGCWDADDRNSSSNGFYTEEDFIEILRYASDRHIRVIPEIESPGHARAAIKSMLAYAERTGDYSMILHDEADTSSYYSAQAYTDNVMNVAMESCYTFMARIIDSLQDMYDKAGVPLDEVHIGGDEVAVGSWIGSPVCRKFMEENGIADAEGLTAYYIGRVADICAERGLKMGCWQDLPMNVSEDNDSDFTPLIGSVNCWNTVAEWGDDHVPYVLANRGYPVILSNVGNTYADMTYSDHPEEHGHQWAGILNDRMSFALLPYDVYRSSRIKLDGSEVDLDNAGEGRPQLKRPENIIGVQAQLFTETVRSFDDVTMLLLPKIVGVFESGWNAKPYWGELRGEREKRAFEEAYGRFFGILADKEMPYYQTAGFAFHLPAPGLHVDDGMLYANSKIEGAEIRYTVDGTMPTAQSRIWSEPVKVDDGTVVHARLYYCGAESITAKLTL